MDRHLLTVHSCGSTTTLKKHLESKHQIYSEKNVHESVPKKPKLEEAETNSTNQQETSSKLVQKTLTSFVRQPLQYEIARMVALDGFTFRQVSNS